MLEYLKFQNYHTARTIRAFTLAEVLITLTVIGVIAALTIPALTTSIQDAQLKTAWKKTYSDINQATSKLLLDNSGSLVGLFSDYNTFRNSYLPYLSYTKYCNPNGGCWHQANIAKHLDGITFLGWADESTYGIILNNGALLKFDYLQSDCLYNRGGIYACGQISVDVNGFKGPNIVGKDIFRAYILKDSILPAGAKGDTYSPISSCNNTSTNGWGCSAQYLYQ